MESVGNLEIKGNMNTVKQLQNNELNIEDFSTQKSRKKQKHHKESKHAVIRYQCEQCDYFATNVSNLKRHEKSKHKEIRYSCDQCDYSATDKSNLKQHKKSKHQGVRYPCDQCEYAATQYNDLKKHQASKHEGVRYLCDQCDYVATQRSSLNRHKKRKHSVDSLVTKKVRNASSRGMLEDQDTSVFYQMEPVSMEIPEIGDVDSGVKAENCIDDPLSLIKIEPIESYIPEHFPGVEVILSDIKQEVDDSSHLEPQIAIEEKIVLKSEFIYNV